MYSERGTSDSATEDSIATILRMFRMISIDDAERTTTACDSTRTQILLESSEMGDRRSSQTYCDPQNLPTPSTPDDYIGTLFGNQVLDHVQHLLAAVPGRNEQTQIQFADNIYKIYPDRRLTAITDPIERNVGAVDDPMMGDMWSEKMAQLQARMSALSLENTVPTRKRKWDQHRSILESRLKNPRLCYCHVTARKHVKNVRFSDTGNTEKGISRP